MADFVILLVIAVAVAGVLWYQRKNKQAMSKEEAVRNSAGDISCGKSCAGCSGCDLGRMGGTPIMEEKPDFQDKKIVFFDIDGTLVDGETHRVPRSAAAAIQKLRQNGHLAFINTGRTLVSINQEIRDVGFDGYVCGCGTHIYHNGKAIFSRSIPHEKCVEIIYKLRQFHINAFFEGPDADYYDGRHPDESAELEGSKKDFARVGVPLGDFPEDLENDPFTFDKFFCFITEKSDLKGLLEYLGDDFTATPQGPKHLEIVPAGCSKAEGIYFLQKRFGICLENCYAIGDSENDLPMLKAVPNSIAMGRCSEAILPFCSYQTERVEEDGIAHALQHYGLI